MAQTQTIDVKIKAILDAGPSIAGLKQLKLLQKEVGSNTAEFKKAQAGINDFNDSIKTAKGQSQDWIDTLGSLPGPLGSIGRGLDTFTSSTNKLGLAFKGLGIGLIVSAVGALTAAFSQNEKMTKKLEPLMIAFEQILGGIFAALEPVINMMIDLAVKAMPLVSDAVKVVYSGISSLLQSLGKLGSALYKLFSGDFSGALDDAKSAFTDFGKNYETATKNFEKGSKELTKTEKKNAEERTKALETEAEKRKKIVDEINAYIAKGVEARGKTEKEELDGAEATYNDLMAKAKKYGLDTAAITKAYEEQKAKIVKTYADKAREDAQKEFDSKLKKQQDENTLLLNQQKANLEQAKVLYGENSAEARKAQDDIFKAQQKALEDEKKLLEDKKELTDAESNRLKQIGIDQQNLTTTIKVENEKRVNSDRETAIKKLEDGKKATDEKFAKDLAAAGNDYELQQQILKDKLASDEAYFASQEALYAGNKEKLDEIDRARLTSQQEIAKSEEEIRQKQVALQLQAADAAINALGAETAAGKAALIAKQFILAKELVLEAKKTIAFSKAALGRSKVAVAEGTAQTAKVGFPQNIPLLILYAAQAISIIKTVIDATKSAKEAEAGGAEAGASSIPAGTAVPKPRGMATGGIVTGPGGSKSDLIPAMLSNGESVINAQSTSAFRPLLSAINEIGGGRRFAEGGIALSSLGQDQTISQLQTMMNTQQIPIKTYVVSSDMTNQQMLDRNIKDRSTI